MVGAQQVLPTMAEGRAQPDGLTLGGALLNGLLRDGVDNRDDIRVIGQLETDDELKPTGLWLEVCGRTVRLKMTWLTEPVSDDPMPSDNHPAAYLSR